MVQEQEGENFQIEVVLFRCAENGSCKQVNGACDKEVVEVGEEGVFEFAVLVERLGHFGPVTRKVFKEVSVSLEFSTLETESLEIADGEECRNREQRKSYKECGCLGALAVEKLGEREYDKG